MKRGYCFFHFFFFSQIEMQKALSGDKNTNANEALMKRWNYLLSLSFHIIKTQDEES